MSKDIIPGLGLPLPGSSTLPDFGGLSRAPSMVTKPGDVADLSGDLWSDFIGDRLVHGEMVVTPEQAQAAAVHGWEAVPGSEHEGKVTVRRADPHPEKD